MRHQKVTDNHFNKWIINSILWSTQYAWAFFIPLLLLALVGFYLVQSVTNSPLIDNLFVILGIMMGDSPVSPLLSKLNQWGIGILLALRCFGWLIIPLIIGIIITNTQEQVEEMAQKALEAEARKYAVRVEARNKIRSQLEKSLSDKSLADEILEAFFPENGDYNK